MTKKNKVLFVIVIILAILIMAYVGSFFTLSGKLLDKYAQGYDKNKLGTYSKNIPGYTLSLDNISPIKTTANLSVASSDGPVDLVIWLSPFGELDGQGVIINDGSEERQVELKDDYTALSDEDKGIVEKYKSHILKLRKIAVEEWGLYK